MTLHAGMQTPMQWQAMQERLAELEAENARLRKRVAALDEPYADDRGEHWRAPTAHAYAAVCKALRTCKAERDAARAAAPKAAKP